MPDHRRRLALALSFLLILGGVLTLPRVAQAERSVADRIEQYGSIARGRLAPYFKDARVSYPPKKIVLLALKDEKRLEVYARGETGTMRYVRAFPVFAASGRLGPKLRQGDFQVPEGIYPIELLNPNSSYHLSLRVGYPNARDRERGRKDGRGDLGGDIMIHGNAVSVGCLAMGDIAAEDLFVLASDVGLKNISVVIAPIDFRTRPMNEARTVRSPAWVNELYDEIREAMLPLPVPGKP